MQRFHGESELQLRSLMEDPEVETLTRSSLISKEDDRTRLTNQTEKEKTGDQVFLEEDDLDRTRSLTDDDIVELKGCLDLGFGFSYQEIPELCNTLPALELCYSMSQTFLDENQKSPGTSPVAESGASPFANWKISSPGDDPDEVKARLKFWAQAVACTVRLCN